MFAKDYTLVNIAIIAYLDIKYKKVCVRFLPVYQQINWMVHSRIVQVKEIVRFQTINFIALAYHLMLLNNVTNVLYLTSVIH